MDFRQLFMTKRVNKGFQTAADSSALTANIVYDGPLPRLTPAALGAILTRTGDQLRSVRLPMWPGFPCAEQLRPFIASAITQSAAMKHPSRFRSSPFACLLHRTRHLTMAHVHLDFPKSQYGVASSATTSHRALLGLAMAISNVPSVA